MRTGIGAGRAADRSMTQARRAGVEHLPFMGMFAMAGVVAAALLFLLPKSLPWQTRALAGWNGAVFVVLVLILFARDAVTPTEPAAAPQAGAYGKTSALVAVLIVCLVSVGATAVTLRTIARHHPGAATHANLSVLAVLSSWLLLQTMFALFYARNYYLPGGAEGKPKRGLEFPSDDVPDFWDFIYFSFTVGFSYAASDTNVTSRVLRRAVLLQAMVSFLFYTIIIGLVMNAILEIV